MLEVLWRGGAPIMADKGRATLSPTTCRKGQGETFFLTSNAAMAHRFLHFFDKLNGPRRFRLPSSPSPEGGGLAWPFSEFRTTNYSS